MKASEVRTCKPLYWVAHGSAQPSVSKGVFMCSFFFGGGVPVGFAREPGSKSTTLGKSGGIQRYSERSVWSSCSFHFDAILDDFSTS